MKIDCNTPLKDLIEAAKDTLVELNTDEVFIVKDLFRGFEWERILRGNRTKLGSMFFYFSENEGNTIIKGLGKTAQNQQIYVKL